MSEAVPVPSLGQRVAEFYIDRFQGLNDPHHGDVDALRFAQAGIILAAQVKLGYDDQAKGFIRDLAPAPEYQVNAVADALEYCDNTMLPTMLESVAERFDPRHVVDVEDRLALLAGVSRARMREPDVEIDVWPDYQEDADSLFEALIHQPAISLNSVIRLFYVGSYTNIRDRDRYVGYMVSRVERALYPRPDDDEGVTAHTYERGKTLAEGALRSVSGLGRPDLERSLAVSLATDPEYRDILTYCIARAIEDGSESAAQTYELFRGTLLPITHENNAEQEYGCYLVHDGRIDEALTLADSLPLYTPRVSIMCRAAEYLAAQGDMQRAHELLAQAGEIDPLIAQPHTTEDSDDTSLSSAEELQGERDLMLESLAEAASQVGDYMLAVSLYARSGMKRPSNGNELAEAALQGSMIDYVRVVLGSDELEESTRSDMLATALSTFQKRDERVDDNGTGPAMEAMMQALVLAYAKGRIEVATRAGSADTIDESLLGLLALCGDDSWVLLAQESTNPKLAPRISFQVIETLAFSGRTDEAMALYRGISTTLTDTQRNLALTAITKNSVLFNDEVTAKAALTLAVMPFQQKEIMASVLYRIGPMLYYPPGWAIALALSTERFDRSQTDISSIANIIHWSGLVVTQINTTGNNSTNSSSIS